MAEEATKHIGGLNNVRKYGLLVKFDEPFLGSSPDGLLSCECCSTALLEAKIMSLQHQSPKYQRKLSKS